MKEFDLLKIVEEYFAHEEVEVPAGKHDAAYVKIGDRFIVISCDTVNERSDFPPFMKPKEIGYMAVAVTLSDLAACGAKPLYFLSSISLKSADEVLFREILSGMTELASKYNVKIIGGDIDFSEILTIAGFAMGESRRIITRSGAKEGENVYITNPTGKAELCLKLLEEGFRREELPYAESLYTPEPRIEEGMRIAEHASAMTDISDSLAISSYLIAASSNVRIVLDDIPTHHLENYAENPLELALYGGGDFELLFTAKESDEGIRIGRVEKGRGVFADVDGELVEIEFRGYSHF